MLKKAVFPLLCGLLFVGVCQQAAAQVRVGIYTKEKLYVKSEPIILNLGITNLAGRELFFSDEPNKPWLVVELFDSNGKTIPAYDAMYRAEPLVIGAGDTASRQINLTPMFPFDRYGQYRVRVSVYATAAERYFSSNDVRFDITEGRIIWQEIIGIPEDQPNAGERRHYELMTHRMLDKIMLYARVTNPDNLRVYTMKKLGRITSFAPPPTVEIDSQNQLFILHMAAPRIYLLNAITPNGDWVARDQYNENNSRPKLVKNDTGRVGVEGGDKDSGADAPGAAGLPADLPRASDRPAGMSPTP